jgi:hypothetical protein
MLWARVLGTIMVDVADVPGLVRADGVTTASAQSLAAGDYAFKRFP